MREVPIKNFEKVLLIKLGMCVFLFNVLRWGFWISGLDHRGHFLWDGLVGPLWRMEVNAVYLCLICAGLFFLFLISTPALKFFLNNWTHKQKQLAEEKRLTQAELDELECQAILQRIELGRIEKENAYMALPEEQRQQMEQAKITAANERRKKYEAKQLEILKAQEVEYERKISEELARQAHEKSLKVVSKKAINEIIKGHWG